MDPTRRTDIDMTEKIEVRKVKHIGEKGNPYYVEEVQCPKTTESQPAHICKKCEHCRIFMGTYTKCTYADDKRRKELKSVTGY